MRTSYSIHQRITIVNLLTAAQQVFDAINDGVFQAATEAQVDRAVEVSDHLAECVTATYADMSINETSPFARYRTTILGGYTTARRLQALTLHLYNSNSPVEISRLLANADERHQRIALELLASYARLGENDHAFMLLAEEIRDLHAQEAERSPEFEEHY